MSCANHGKKDATGIAIAAQGKAPDHLASDSLQRAQEGKLSPMDKKIYGAAKAFGSGKTEFKTSAFGGNKEFHSGKGDFKTSTFAQGNKETRDTGTKFLSGKGGSSMGDKKFVSKENALGKKTNSDNAKMFSGNNKEFSNKGNYSAEKAVRESRKPLLLGDQQNIEENQLQKLLNKQ